jgi:hypothetical protein
MAKPAKVIDKELGGNQVALGISDKYSPTILRIVTDVLRTRS